MKGLIHIYCGEGKGKTTAAMGLCLRAAASGKKVVLVQFLKDGTSNELKLLAEMENVYIVAGKVCKEFVWNMSEEQKAETKKVHTENLKKALDLNPEVLVLDEICAACSTKLIDEELIKDTVVNKPENMELILTGRDPKDYMMECADYITEMKKIRHPFDKGVHARKGIEF